MLFILLPYCIKRLLDRLLATAVALFPVQCDGITRLILCCCRFLTVSPAQELFRAIGGFITGNCERRRSLALSRPLSLRCTSAAISIINQLVVGVYCEVKTDVIMICLPITRNCYPLTASMITAFRPIIKPIFKLQIYVCCTRLYSFVVKFQTLIAMIVLSFKSAPDILTGQKAFILCCGSKPIIAIWNILRCNASASPAYISTSWQSLIKTGLTNFFRYKPCVYILIKSCRLRRHPRQPAQTQRRRQEHGKPTFAQSLHFSFHLLIPFFA